MLKILSTSQIREADRATIERETIESVDLMERAAGECSKWLQDHYAVDRPIVVFAGVGNNGGDALVMSRKLIEAGYTVSTFLVRYSEKFSEDLQVNLDRLKDMGHEVEYILEEHHFPTISSDAVILDGLFGSGLNRKVEGMPGLCIGQINASIAEVVAIDMPSGMFADEATPKDGAVIMASHTLTFQVPKLAFFLPDSEEFVGEWHLIDIGLNSEYLNTVEAEMHYVDQIAPYTTLFSRAKFSHKGTFGHGLLICGGYGKMGAAVLATRAALRSGIGKLTSHVPHSGNSILQQSAPEAMTSVDEYDEYVGELPSLSGFNAIGIGPGIGKAKKTKRLLKALISETEVPVVFDADALNLLSENPEYQKNLGSNSILTPHVGEFDRLFGASKSSYDRLVKLRSMAKKLGCIIVLKGASTSICAPNGTLYFNATGNPGMATAGSGDVLTGIITAFLAQINDPLIATICAVYIHGKAGDLAAQSEGAHSMIAGDIIDHIGRAMQQSLELKP